MSSLLKDLLKITDNEYASVVDDGIDFSDLSGHIDTNCYSLNALVSGSIFGGIPNNKVLALAGESSTGKTYFALSIIHSFLKANPEGVCMYFDSESAVTSDMIKTRGIDPKRIAVLGVSTIEEFRNQSIKILDSYLALSESDRKPMIIVLDSLGMLSSNKEMADTAEGKDTRDMTKSQVIKGVFRVLTLKLSKAKVPLIFTAHTYDQINSMFPQKIMAGGNALRYAASTVLFLSKRKEKEDNEVIGNVIHCKLDKGRFAKENKVVDVLLRYDTGLNKYYGLLPIVEKYGIFKKVSTRYELPDGTKVFEKQLKENPEKYFTPEILKKIDEVCKLEFTYGSDIKKKDEMNNETSSEISDKI